MSERPSGFGWNRTARAVVKGRHDGVEHRVHHFGTRDGGLEHLGGGNLLRRDQFGQSDAVVVRVLLEHARSLRAQSPFTTPTGSSATRM